MGKIMVDDPTIQYILRKLYNHKKYEKYIHMVLLFSYHLLQIDSYRIYSSYKLECFFALSNYECINKLNLPK